jgi:Rieske [2Fe-2S] domain
VLHGVWLGHPLHPVLVQAPVGAWLSASMVDVLGDHRSARRLAAAGLAASVPAAVAGAADWSEQHEQQMRVGVVHAAANFVAMSLYGASLLARGPRLGPVLRLAGLASVAVSGLAGGCLTCPWHGSVFRLADGSVARGPATAPQPAFRTREVGGAIQVCLPGAG